MIKLTDYELSILRAFEGYKSEWDATKGWDDPDVDALACRGLLVRIGKVKKRLDGWQNMERNMGAIATDNRRILRDRSQTHEYYISRRGLKALKHATAQQWREMVHS